ncbi:murein peptide amidase A [Mariprofundus sp. KV]|nr:murein peptide amidase A [Mariprofundus sp. KV]
MSVKTATINSCLAARRATAIVAPMPHVLPSITALFFSTLLLLPAPLLASEANSAESPSAIVNECKRIGNKLGSVSTRECLSHQLQESGGTSVTGQAIMIKEYPPLAAREPKARILLIGGTHGDEYSSVSIIFKWMKTLDIHHSGLFHWHVSPLVNPDGLLQRPSQRLNANGVDLNRNMPTPDWYKSTSAYWEKTGFDKRRYPGTAPLSEPESRWLYEEIRTFKPHAIVSVHAPYGVLDFDGPPVGPNQLGQLHLHLIGTYPGSLGNSAGVQHQIPVITVELPHAGIMPSEDEISRMWMDLIRWLRLNVPKEKTTRAYATFDETSKQLMASPAVDTGQQTKAPAAAAKAAATEAEKSSDIHMNSRIDN